MWSVVSVNHSAICFFAWTQIAGTLDTRQQPDWVRETNHHGASLGFTQNLPGLFVFLFNEKALRLLLFTLPSENTKKCEMYSTTENPGILGQLKFSRENQGAARILTSSRSSKCHPRISESLRFSDTNRTVSISWGFASVRPTIMTVANPYVNALMCFGGSAKG